MFFNALTTYQQNIVAIEQGMVTSYAELAERCQQFSEQLTQTSELKRPLLFVKAHNNVDTLVVYLSALQNKFPVLLLDPDIEQEKLANLLRVYQPNFLLENKTITPLNTTQHKMADTLALMLSTSGSTGSPKQVCLSQQNLQANAQSICDYLPIQLSDKTITTLPFFYSYGLSVINSHLLAGACIVFNQHTMLSREFWQVFNAQQISSFAGVPYHYEMLLKLRFERMDLPSLRYFTQAGGKLSEPLVKKLSAYASSQHKAFFMMYGQTEATARMAYLPSDKVSIKPNSIGQAIPNGEFSLLDEQGMAVNESNQAGELVYSGPNVMLGYAEYVTDLTGLKPITQLHTGDIASRDSDGDYFIVGRKKRFIKLFGQRINLDEVEQLLAKKQLETYCLGDDTKLIVAIKKANDIKVLRTTICRLLNIHISVIEVLSVDELPVTANGKKDYKRILEDS